jgi:DNA-binding MarR family transcriptional regulator
MGLARYQGLAFGPVARTVRTLIERGYLKKCGSAGKGRAERIEVTTEGLRILDDDPLHILSNAIGRLEADRQEALAEALDGILRATSEASGTR